MIYLGFDTSNYTTSAACCGDADINIRKILEVKQGDRGLRQSDALFQHVKQLPQLFEELCRQTDVSKTAAIGVSYRPRSVEGSYMPVFLAGEGYAKVCAAVLGVPLYRFSHQDGHIMAGIISAKADFLLDKPFISVHLSGGTCEILRTEYNGYGFEVEIIGGTKDISAGQLIDRVGVALGMKFPAGAELEKLAMKAQNASKLPVNSSGGYINFSGIETKSLSLARKTDNSELALGVFNGVGEAVARAVNHCCRSSHINDVLFVGGVMASSILKKYILENVSANSRFALPQYSTDNAYGIAALTKYAHKNHCKQ